MTDVTHLLAAVNGGDPEAAAALLPIVYDELRKLAALASMFSHEDRAKQVFLEALDHKEDLQVFIDQACDGDKELQQRVVALLNAHQQAGEFLRDSNLDATSDGVGGDGVDAPREAELQGERPAGPQCGTKIGRYKLLERIAEGGMGSVWVAEQIEPVHRKVALKLIKAGMDSKSVLARFEAERQALAIMDHPIWLLLGYANGQ